MDDESAAKNQLTDEQFQNMIEELFSNDYHDEQNNMIEEIMSKNPEQLPTPPTVSGVTKIRGKPTVAVNETPKADEEAESSSPQYEEDVEEEKDKECCKDELEEEYYDQNNEDPNRKNMLRNNLRDFRTKRTDDIKKKYKEIVNPIDPFECEQKQYGQLSPKDKHRLGRIHWKQGVKKREDIPIYRNEFDDPSKMSPSKFDEIYEKSRQYILPS